MEENYTFDHARPIRWYHLPIVAIGFGIGKLVDLSRDARCKMFGHRPVYGQINYGQCNRCNRPLR